MLETTNTSPSDWHQRSPSSSASGTPPPVKPGSLSQPSVNHASFSSVASSLASPSLLKPNASSTAQTQSSARRTSPSLSTSTTTPQSKRNTAPYIIPSREIRHNPNEKRQDEQTSMATVDYNHWIKPEIETGRDQNYIITRQSAQHTPATARRTHMSNDPRPRSSHQYNPISSTLRGAMGEVNISSISEGSGSPSPSSDGSRQHRSAAPYNVPPDMVWTQTNPEVPEQAALPAPTYELTQPASYNTMPSPPSSLPSGSNQYHPEYTGSYSGSSTPYTTQPHHHAPNQQPAFTHSPYHNQYSYTHTHPRSQSSLGGPGILTQPSEYPSGRGSMTISPAPGIPAPVPTRAVRSADEELHILRTRVRELELINDQARLRIRELEAELTNPPPIAESGRASSSIAGPSSGSLSTSSRTQPAMNPAFHASWRARYDARIKLFCSLNRAGNALCAWHDSRRERRAHPPRMAPPGHLNCGCTYDEALFEESLARHGVGSYHPGESVRMDPALRNPLLKLLQERFGYRDGDFERDAVTGNWVDGEGHAVWEAKALQGASGHRKGRTGTSESR